MCVSLRRPEAPEAWRPDGRGKAHMHFLPRGFSLPLGRWAHVGTVKSPS